MKQIRNLRNKQIVPALQRARSVLLVAHISPDGDAVGSMLACGKMLMDMGKQVTMALSDPVPQRLRFLPGADRIVSPDCLAGRHFDLGFALDCGDAGRMGGCEQAYFACTDTIQLDHHETNPGFAAVNEVDGGASSTGCMLWRLMGEMGVRPDPEIAECIYCAVSTDTGNFCFSSTDEETLLCAADMVSTGFDLNRAARRIHLIQETPHVRLLGRAVLSLRFFADGRCTSMTLTEADYRESDAKPEHCDGIVNVGLNLPDVRMTYLLDLRQADIVKISFRAVEPYRVSGIAGLFGGGGHTLAAGLRTQGDPEEICLRIEEEMRKQIESVGQ